MLPLKEIIIKSLGQKLRIIKPHYPLIKFKFKCQSGLPKRVMIATVANQLLKQKQRQFSILQSFHTKTIKNTVIFSLLIHIPSY